tara:strand:- start:384 stop:1100 length:717 start_codon:yes stop_codon:yes gene_type:complete
MSKNNFDTYLEFNLSNLNISTFNNLNDKVVYFEEKNYKKFFNKDNKEINFDDFNLVIEENILKIEKLTSEFIKDIFLIIETPQSISIKLSVVKNNEGEEINKDDLTYLIQDSMQQILKFNNNLMIIHTIIENYNLDNKNFKLFPSGIKCKHFSLDIKFICFPRKLVNSFEKLFLKKQIVVKKFICANYVKSFESNFFFDNNCAKGREIVNGLNKQEVVSVPKKIEKIGFFEKLFHFFR